MVESGGLGQKDNIYSIARYRWILNPKPKPEKMTQIMFENYFILQVKQYYRYVRVVEQSIAPV